MPDVLIVLNKVKQKNFYLIKFRDRLNNKNKKSNCKMKINCNKILICTIVLFVVKLQNGKTKNLMNKIKLNFHNANNAEVKVLSNLKNVQNVY